MAFSFLKTTGKSAPQKSDAEINSGIDKKKATLKPGTSGINFLKTGNKAKEALSVEEARAEAQQAESERMWRWMLGEDESGNATFLDGELDSEGMLDIQYFSEHTCQVNGRWRNFVCTSDHEPCPICNQGDSRASFVGAMTILDHRKHKIQKGPNAGKILVNQRKLFIAKRRTLADLTKIAIKRDGLAGCSFDISRGNKQTPSVGSMFEFENKFESYNEIAEKFKLNLEDVEPANYTEEIIYYTAEQLQELGVGQKIKGIGYGKSSSSGFGSKSKTSASSMAEKL